MTGISRKLPDTERTRLKAILKKVVPEDAGVIVRTAAEGASEEELSRDVARLTAQWEDIEKKAQDGRRAPALLYGEPDLTIRVVRDIFNEDFTKLVVAGDDAWDMLEAYVGARRPRPRATGCPRWTDERGRLRRPPDRRAARQGAGPQGLAALRRLAGHRPHRGDDRRRRQHRQVHRLRAATSRRPSPRTTWRRPRRSSASSGCATSAASSSSTSSTWCWRATATWCCAGCWSAWAATAPSTRWPRSPRSGLVQMTRKRVGQGLLEAFSETCEALQRPRLPRPHRSRWSQGQRRRHDGRRRRAQGRRGGGRPRRGQSRRTRGRGRARRPPRPRRSHRWRRGPGRSARRRRRGRSRGAGRAGGEAARAAADGPSRPTKAPTAPPQGRQPGHDAVDRPSGREPSV